MIVVILHPEQETQIRKFQNELCNFLNSSSKFSTQILKKNILFPKYPVWFEFQNETDAFPDEQSKETIKTFSNSITNIVLTPVIDQKKCCFSLKLFLKSDCFEASLPFFANQYDFNSEQLDEINSFLSTYSNLPQKIKIIRIGKKIQLTEQSQALEYFVWKKVK